MAASPGGGNVAGSTPGRMVAAGTDEAVKVLGFSDLPARLPATASELFAANVLNFVLSLTPPSPRPRDGDSRGAALAVDPLSDAAVGCMLVCRGGKSRWPTPPYRPPPLTQSAPQAPPRVNEAGAAGAGAAVAGAAGAAGAGAAEAARPLSPTARGAANAAVAAGLLVAAGAMCGGDPGAAALLNTFLLSAYAGFLVVRGVPPALHSPLMAVTNAVSGLTAVAGLALVLAHSSAPPFPGGGLGVSPLALGLGAAATALSAVNVVGGGRVAATTLGLFHRRLSAAKASAPVPEPWRLYAAPFAVAAVGRHRNRHPGSSSCAPRKQPLLSCTSRRGHSAHPSPFAAPSFLCVSCPLVMIPSAADGAAAGGLPFFLAFSLFRGTVHARWAMALGR